MRMRLVLLCSMLLTSTSVGPALAQDGGTLVELVRDATERFKDVNVALSEGYAPEPCVSGPNGGAMGVHYVNAEYQRWSPESEQSATLGPRAELMVSRMWWKFPIGGLRVI